MCTWRFDQVFFFGKVLAFFGKCHCHIRKLTLEKQWVFSWSRWPSWKMSFVSRTWPVESKGSMISFPVGHQRHHLESWYEGIGWDTAVMFYLHVEFFSTQICFFCFVSNAEPKFGGLGGDNAVCPAAARERSASSQDKAASCHLSEVCCHLSKGDSTPSWVRGCRIWTQDRLV